MIDMVVHRHELRPTLARLCRSLTKSPEIEVALPTPPEPTTAISAELAGIPEAEPAAPYA